MGNEMGNNNTSELREEEKAKTEAPEKSLLEGGGNEVNAYEVADFCKKEARSGSDDADRVNGDHHVTEKEEGKNGGCYTAKFQVISKSTDRTKEDNEVQTKFKEDETTEFNLKENGLDGNKQEHEKQTSNRKEEGEKGSNLNTTKLALDEPELEKISDFKSIQNELLDTKAESLVEDSNKFPQLCKEDLGLSLNYTYHSADCTMADSENTTNMNQISETVRDTDKENDGDRGRGSNFNTIIHASDDPKSEKILDLESFQNEFPPTKAEPMVGSSDGSPQENKYEKILDVESSQNELPPTKVEPMVGSSDGSPQESKYALGSSFSLKHSEVSGRAIVTDKSTNVDRIGAETDTDVEKKKDELIEPRSCHEYIMPAAKNVNKKEEQTTTDLISHKSSGSQPEESLVVESPKSSMQAPEVEDRCTVLEEETQMREEPSGTGTIVQDNCPTQFKISNGVQEELNTIGSHSENNAEETEISPDSVAKNQNEAPGEDCESSDGEYLEIAEQGMAISTLSVGNCKHKNDEKGETLKISIDNGHEAERRESEENLSKPVLGFQPQIHLQETSIKFQTTKSTDESISALRQETETAIEKSEKNSSGSPHCIRTASATFTETKPSTNLIDKQSARTLPFSTFGEENQESPGRTSNESNSDNSIGNIEMRKSPSFNIDIQIEGRAGDTDKTPLLYQIKTIENLPNLHEKRVVTLGRSDSDKSRPSFPGFAKEKEEAHMEMKAINQNNSAAAKKAAEDLSPTSQTSPIRKGKRRTKSLIFGTCICCATAIN